MRVYFQLLLWTACFSVAAAATTEDGERGHRRVALCISGQMRTHLETLDKLRAKILGVLQPDIFIHTWAESGETAHEIRDSLEAIYRPVSAVVEALPPNSTRQLFGVGIPQALQDINARWPPGTLPGTYKRWACNGLKSLAEQARGFVYDMVIHTD